MLPANVERGSLADVRAEIIRELIRFVEARIGPKCGCLRCAHMRGVITLAREMVP